jgi:small subunit ribosomal protein S1
MNIYRPEGTLITEVKNNEYTCSIEGLERALRQGVILEGRVLLCDAFMNLHVDFGNGLRGIIPKDECQYSEEKDEVKDIAILTRVGKTVCFKVIGFKETGTKEKCAVLSRRQAQIECKQYYVDTLSAGDVILARITHLEHFGAFADIGCGIISLLSIDQMSVSRISHPKERVSVGDMIYAVVKSVDEKGRISLSERELLGTWEENAALFSEGETVEGIIRSVEDYGVFVELTPNLAGLAEYRDDVYPGESVAVYIKSIIPEKMKIKLIIIDVSDDAPKKAPVRYFIDPHATPHIDFWKYSPESAKKQIETVF